MKFKDLGRVGRIEKKEFPSSQAFGHFALCKYTDGHILTLCPWDSPGKNTGVGSHSLLQGIFPTQGSNLGLLHCRLALYCLSHQGDPKPKTQTKPPPSMFQSSSTQITFQPEPFPAGTRKFLTWSTSYISPVSAPSG